jgi:putative flippase GtrA
MASNKSLRQFLRYILVGGFNTVFGYGVFALLTRLLTGLGTYNYLYAALLANLIAITASFLCYKWFVFRSRGNYLLEWVRCIGVYGSSMLVTLIGLPIIVSILRRHLHQPSHAPYIAGAIMTVVTVLFSFIGHKNVSFGRQLADDEEKKSAAGPAT